MGIPELENRINRRAIACHGRIPRLRKLPFPAIGIIFGLVFLNAIVWVAVGNFSGLLAPIIFIYPSSLMQSQHFHMYGSLKSPGLEGVLSLIGTQLSPPRVLCLSLEEYHRTLTFPKETESSRLLPTTSKATRIFSKMA